MNWFDILVLIVAIYSIFKGYKSGLIKQLASLAGFLACALLSGKISTMLLPYIHQIEQVPTNLSEPLAFILSFIIIFSVFMLIGHMLQSILKTIKLDSINKLGGSALSLAKWMIAVSIALNLFIKMDSESQIIPSDIDSQSITFQYVEPIASKIVPYLNYGFEQTQNLQINKNDKPNGEETSI